MAYQNPQKLTEAIAKAVREQYPDGPTHVQKLRRTLSPKSDGEDALFFQIKTYTSLELPEREVQLFPERKWRFDFVWRKQMVIFEVEGGVWVGGRHTRPRGFINDIEKYTAAMNIGFQVYRVTTEMVKNWLALKLISDALKPQIIRASPRAR